MAILPNTGEPFGLPNGTVRGVIALAFTGVTLQQFIALGHAPDVALLGITTLIVGNYFGTRAAETSTAAAVAATVASQTAVTEPLPAPVPGNGADET